jgi:predicted acylesterase/phospholipase RssA
MKALVLSGGGAHGAYEAGVAKALLMREQYDLICGVSIGAINAALIAAPVVDDALELFWHREFPARALDLFPHVPRLRRLLAHLGTLGNGNGWRDAVTVARAARELPFLSRLGSVHRTSLPAVASALSMMVDFKAMHTSMLVGATNASHASAAVFGAFVGARRPQPRHARLTEYRDLTEDNFVMALLASSAMPGLFSPIELTFGGQSALYADGCLVHTSPLGLAVDNGATELTVVFVDQELDPEVAGAAQGLRQMAYNIATLWQQRLLDYELRLAEATNEIVRLGGAAGKRQISIRYVRPSKPLELDMLAFDDVPAIGKAFEQGFEDGVAAELTQMTRPHPVPAQAKSDTRFWRSLRGLFPRSASRAS